MAAADLEWEGSYLRSHWDGVVAALARHRAGHISGLLAPAKVLSVDGDVLRLGYDQGHEGIRRRCADRMDEQITSALGRLFGREVRCEYVATGAAGEPPQPANAALSTAERTELNNDPAVKAVLDFFGGSVTDIRRQMPRRTRRPSATKTNNRQTAAKESTRQKETEVVGLRDLRGSTPTLLTRERQCLAISARC